LNIINNIRFEIITLIIDQRNRTPIYFCICAMYLLFYFTSTNAECARQLNENFQHAYLSIKQIKIIDCCT